MRLLMVSALSYALLCGCGRAQQISINTVDTLKKEDPEAVLVPESVKKYLEEKFNGWELAEMGDYSSLWWSFYDKTHIPYAVSADFNDDQAADYALIIKKADSVKLIVLTGNGTGFRDWGSKDFILDDKAGGIRHGLAVVPPGQIDVLRPEVKSLILKSNGLALYELESRRKIFYLDNESLKIFEGE